MLPLLLTFTLLTSPVFDVYKVPDSYIQSAYQIADSKLDLMDDEDIIEEEIVEEQIDDEIYNEEIPEDPEEDTEDYSVMALNDVYVNYEYSVLHNTSVPYLFVSSSITPFSLRQSSNQLTYIMLDVPGSYIITFNYDLTGVRYGLFNDFSLNASSIGPYGEGLFNTVEFDLVEGQFFYISTSRDPQQTNIAEAALNSITILYKSSDSPVEPPSYDFSELINLTKSIDDSLELLMKYNNYELYSDAAAFEASDMYINKYEFETFKLLRYLVILVACNIGAIFILLFSLRCRNGTS